MKLKELAAIKKGKKISDSELVNTKPYKETHYAYLTINHIVNNVEEKFITKKAIEKSNVWVGSILLKYGDYLLFKKDNKFQVISFLDNEPTVIDQDIWIIRPQNNIAEMFFGYENNQQYFINELEKNEQIGLKLGDFIGEVNIPSAPENCPNLKNDGLRKNLSNSDFPIKLTSKPVEIARFSTIFFSAIEFQKKPNTWNIEVKSRFIETLMTRLPSPDFYFDATHGTWLVMDGFQRLNAIFGFYNQKFALENLDFLTDLEGKTFHQLPRQYQKNIEEYIVTAHIFEKGNSQQAKYKILKNINVNNPYSTAQEIRHLVCRGLSHYLKEKVEEIWFKNLVPTRIADKVNMFDIEIILRYLAFQYKNYTIYTSPMVDFLDDAMANLKIIPKQYENLRSILIFLSETFGEPCFSRSCFDKKGCFYVHNNIIFELLTYGFSLIIKDIQNIGVEQKVVLKKEIIAFFEKQANEIPYFWEEDYAYSKKGLQQRFRNMEIFIENLKNTIYDK